MNDDVAARGEHLVSQARRASQIVGITAQRPGSELRHSPWRLPGAHRSRANRRGCDAYGLVSLRCINAAAEAVKNLPSTGEIPPKPAAGPIHPRGYPAIDHAGNVRLAGVLLEQLGIRASSCILETEFGETPGALNRDAKSFVIDRLEQVIQGVDFKRTQRMLLTT